MRFGGLRKSRWWRPRDRPTTDCVTDGLPRGPVPEGGGDLALSRFLLAFLGASGQAEPRFAGLAEH